MNVLKDVATGVGLVLATPVHMLGRLVSNVWWPLKGVKDEIVLITGGGSGIGKGMALKFADLGATVVIWDVNKKGADAVVAEIREKHGQDRAHAYAIDITDREKVYALAKQVKREVGAVTILVNNAGIVTGKPFLEADDSKMVKTMEVNTIAHFWTTKAFLPDMLEKNHGHIVTVASSAGKVGVASLADYCASKFGAVGFDESIRFELRKMGKTGVHTTCVCPFFIDTGMFEGAKTKVPWLLPILKPELVVDRTIRAIRMNQATVAIPRFLYFGQFLQGILPPSISDAIVDLFGANDSMDDFIGRTKKD
ncbi:epidermal retinol dehydrogenase 2 [Salpingoeca rosetta]|uniref:Epidermal retinol dehydrogenase 2 n=1 Tax=Salpingoeca rosetta (strain ATCC 50818 / BSB-021) TaxID=946362 RepID=F2UQY4_SALR5|nr:epidermal retinol dehydrogenase 2 [Salpingoeca rosetta]EGD80039.1 epidermal retinol dehydrogenase 2 [Salpingoeca rosetta]|eukprot:XP_004988364.1 epidermal retinol dehydrogenase 2 [Salpingoeca rosetta]